MAGCSESCNEALTCFISATTDILTDDGFSVPTKGAERCLDIAKKFNEILKNPTPVIISFSEKLVCQMKKILGSKSLKRENLGGLS